MTEWSVLIKVARDEGEPPIWRSEIDALVASLPGTDKGCTGGDGPDATISFWVDAPDASSAVVEGWRHIDAARERLGLPSWRPIRTHAASAAQRLTGFAGVEERTADETAWSVLLKSVRLEGGGIDGEGRARLAEALGEDATVGGDKDTIVARFWVSAPDAGEADRAARAVLEAALDAQGGGGTWTFVRAHHAVAHERAEEIYRGAAERAARGQG
jgi:hypothetical protein